MSARTTACTPAANGARRPRVLMGIPAPRATGGGPALHLPMLVEDLRAAGAVELVTFPYGRWAEGEPAWLKVLHQFVDLLRYPWRLRAVRPDLVHLNTSLDRRALVRDTAFVAVTRALRVPVFVKWHGSQTPLFRSALWGRVARSLLRAVDGIGLLSEPERQEILAAEPRARTYVVKNSIDAGRYAAREDLRAAHELPADAVLLLFVSRLIPGKGLRETVEAMAHLAELPAHLLVIGDGPERRPAAQRAVQLGIRDRVHFLGRMPESETARYYAGCDVLVFPSSLTEGFPMTLFQGVVAGMAIVTTRVRAAIEHLREPDHCRFVPAGDVAALAATLRALVLDPEARRRMAANNRLLAPRFDRRTVAREFASVYAQLLAGDGGAATPAASPAAPEAQPNPTSTLTRATAGRPSMEDR